MPPLRLLALALSPLTLVLAAANADSSTSIPPSHPEIRYEGRFDTRDRDDHIAIIWQASRIHLGFDGDSLELLFSDAKGQNFFDATIDGHTSIVEVREGSAPKNARFQNLGPGPHRLTLFKRSEADAGHVRFLGVKLAAGGKLLPLPAATPRLRFQFFGDSITAGACNEDGDTDQWEDRRTHNAANSYAAMTAAAFDADHRNISVSGMGISIGWVEKRTGEIWDRLYPEIGSPRADLTDWIPDAIFLNYGENDDSFTKAHDLPFPADFTERYVAVVRDIRRAFPSAHIVILRGGMAGGAQSERLRDPWERVVTQLEAGDARLTHFVFNHWSRTHPRVADARAMADELITWLRPQPFIDRK